MSYDYIEHKFIRSELEPFPYEPKTVAEVMFDKNIMEFYKLVTHRDDAKLSDYAHWLRELRLSMFPRFKCNMKKGKFISVYPYKRYHKLSDIMDKDLQDG